MSNVTHISSVKQGAYLIDGVALGNEGIIRIVQSVPESLLEGAVFYRKIVNTNVYRGKDGNFYIKK